MGKKEFVATMLNLEHETYVVHIGLVSSVASPSSSPLNAQFFYKPQIAGLITKEAPTKISNKYINFTDIFSLDLASKLPKYIGINDHTIKLVNGQRPPYRSIYSLGSVELETLKAYIETNLANEFIKLSNSPANTPILFDQKSEGFFQLYVDHKGPNNLSIKN